MRRVSVVRRVAGTATTAAAVVTLVVIGGAVSSSALAEPVPGNPPGGSGPRVVATSEAPPAEADYDSPVIRN